MLSMTHVRIVLATLCLLPTSAAAAHDHRLAIVVPIARYDLEMAIDSLSSWPCGSFPGVDLLLLHDDEAAAVGAEGTLGATVNALADGGCFGEIAAIFSDLDEEESVDPSTSRSAMFYKMFEDFPGNIVRPQLEEYAAIAVVDWERAVAASVSSFEQLHREAFISTSSSCSGEDFWVKGGRDARGVVDGGAAIYNNRDPAFVTFLAHARVVSGLATPHEVAMGRAVSSFRDGGCPASDKFVRADLISENGDDTPFVRVSSTPSTAATADVVAPAKSTKRRLLYKQDVRCFQGCEATSEHGTWGRVCDPSCATGNPYGTHGCNTKWGYYGPDCRQCFNDLNLALAHDDHASGKRAIICDTMEPPTVYGGHVNSHRRGLQDGKENDVASNLHKLKTNFLNENT